MTLRKFPAILTILCLLALTGTVLAAPVAQETPQPDREIGVAGPAATKLAIGDDLEYELPIDTMEVIGRYNVTIDPAANATIEPINLDAPLDVRRSTPIGALDAVAQSEGLNYTTYYYTVSDRLAVDSINDYVYEEEKVWYVLNDLNESFFETSLDARAHNLTDGETFWFIYCDLTDYDPRYESRADRAVAGLSITVAFGEENVTPTPTGNVTPTPTGNVTPTPTGNVTPTPTGNVTPMPTGNVTPMPTGNVTPTPTGNVTPTPTGNMTPTPTGNVTPMPTPVEQMGLDKVIGEEGNLSILAALISVTNLTATLQGEGPYTVFAPDNDAFGNLTPDILAGIFTDEEERTRVLSNHVVNGSYTAAGLLNMTGEGNATTLTTLAGGNLTVSASGGMLAVDNATITMQDINATNGVVHVIGAVLLPPENQTAQPTTTPMENATAQPTPLVNMTGFPEGTL